MSCAVALIALSLGYLVYVHASKEKEGVKLLGQVIGIVVMIGAVMTSVMHGYNKCHKHGHGGQFSEKAAMCPFSAKDPEKAESSE